MVKCLSRRGGKLGVSLLTTQQSSKPFGFNHGEKQSGHQRWGSHWHWHSRTQNLDLREKRVLATGTQGEGRTGQYSDFVRLASESWRWALMAMSIGKGKPGIRRPQSRSCSHVFGTTEQNILTQSGRLNIEKQGWPAQFLTIEALGQTIYKLTVIRIRKHLSEHLRR